MIFLKILLITIEVLCSLLLIGVVLLQKSKGEGLGMAFGAEMGESLFGARAGNVLTRITIWLAVIFMLNTIFLAKIYTRRQSGSVFDRITTSAPVPVDQPAASAPVPVDQPTAPVPMPVEQPVVPAPMPVETE